ncbi:hypothetical protein JOF29_006055 [Kribbella aluminosa]|uniref:FCS-type domain-containing protein n=1 Tax=Kribbella aluminosa TaxID=416017 RepID=A0ABS4UTJ3_9ACTN|nr:hypothetical protein [Kribbella aluminosa]MBP2354945.1 hypothetical protein [Kribbella aluminosa]
MSHTAISSDHISDRACEHCAVSFIARRSDQRFCSDRCRLRHWRLQKSAASVTTNEGLLAASHVQAARQILLGLIDADPRAAVAERVRVAFAELAKLDQAIIRLQRQTPAPRSSNLAPGEPSENRSIEC